ncbi:hypothetical protein E1A91_A07G074000v1 [Gossypium mustelinum]|uniref:Uncharacterized protein n=3 Tax=Gossypium TaxID=3633 RepID=A0A5J5V0P0_GOSBA|nr:hypothetical protein ES319_A07G073200v1 [Gossypium barbadense]TYH09203.1 hypothetical protein ES288_A07G076800v1 [Gossypium darwinii]TYH09204.1 hypothetical protein ES288_A07G076800v1 [Gossypium darwinii]TYJ25801.1 hypothetical protein E1A91_A07G074000v1 [Gossypium mustelinum]
MILVLHAKTSATNEEAIRFARTELETITFPLSLPELITISFRSKHVGLHTA